MPDALFHKPRAQSTGFLRGFRIRILEANCGGLGFRGLRQVVIVTLVGPVTMFMAILQYYC